MLRFRCKSSRSVFSCSKQVRANPNPAALQPLLSFFLPSLSVICSLLWPNPFFIFHSDISFPAFLSLPVSAWCHVYNHLNAAVLTPKILHSPWASHCYIFLSLAHLRSCSVTIRHLLIPNPLSQFRFSFPRFPITPGLPTDQMLSVIYYRAWQNWPTFKCHNRLLDTSHLSNLCSFFLYWFEVNKVELFIVVLYYSRPRLQQEGFYMTIFKCEHLDSGYTTEQSVLCVLFLV